MTAVRQISVFLENRKGSLAAVCSLIGKNGINILALSIVEKDSFGVCRMILNSTEKAAEILKKRGYTVRVQDVLVVKVPDRPSGLAEVLEVIEKEDISVEYLYSFVENERGSARLIFRLSDAMPDLVDDGLYCLEKTWKDSPDLCRKVRRASSKSSTG